jgi:hypothetical protein
MSVLLPDQGRNSRSSRPGQKTPSYLSPPVTSPTVLPSSEPESHGAAGVLRFVSALAVAVFADLVLGFIPTPLDIVADFVVAMLLFSILGFNWIFLPALVIEVIPGVGLFPTWTLVVLGLAGYKIVTQK